jgi:hypothetical protein
MPIFNLRMSKDITPQLPVIIGTLSIACPVGRGKLRPLPRDFDLAEDGSAQIVMRGANGSRLWQAR